MISPADGALVLSISSGLVRKTKARTGKGEVQQTFLSTQARERLAVKEGLRSRPVTSSYLLRARKVGRRKGGGQDRLPETPFRAVPNVPNASATGWQIQELVH